MIEVQETDSGLYVTDAAKNELHIEMPDWREGGRKQAIDRDVDETIAGYASAVCVPQSAVCIETEGRQRWRTYGNETHELEIEIGTHLIQISSNLYVYIRVTGGFTISRNVDDSRIRIDFGSETAITLGIRSLIRRPTATIRTPGEPEPLAEAVSHLSVALDTTTPDRSYPSLRGYPPRLEIDDELEIPQSVQNNVVETGITIRIPRELSAVFTVAPLAYYLQAELTVEAIERPVLEIRGESDPRDLGNGGALEDNVVNTLRRVFWLDCLVRNKGPFGVDLVEEELLTRIKLDPGTLYTSSPRERLHSYLESDFELIEEDLPEWHLATYVDPIGDNVPAIPHLLEKLSLVYPPKSRPAERNELLDYSLDKFYRSIRASSSTEPVRHAEPRFPEFKHGRVLGWLADGYPVDVFKANPQAFENKLNYLDSVNRTKRIVVILNDQDMEEERAVVSNSYNDRAKELTIDISVRRNVSAAELANELEAESDFVHYIGHCSESGLLCKDGYLSISSLNRSRAKTFFLNACGSFKEGKALINKGSVGGVVTRNKVLNREATRIGSTLANLIVHGFGIERSLKLAKKKSIVNFDYFVVGDGTYTLIQGDHIDPSYYEIVSKSDNYYEVTDIMTSNPGIGTCRQTYLSESDDYTLTGNSPVVTIDRGDLIENLNSYNCPVIFDGTYYWSDELSIKLRN